MRKYLRLGCLWMGVAVALSGCGGSGDGEPLRESLTTRQDQLVAHCRRSDGGDTVEVFDAAGKLELEVLLTLTRDAHGTAQLTGEWSYHGSGGVSGDRVSVAGDQLPACKDANSYALTMDTSVKKGYFTPENQNRKDSWGCDGIPFASFFECGGAGSCCDTHDFCYAANGCSSASWQHTLACSAAAAAAGAATDPVTGLVLASLACYDTCDLCNIDVAACFTASAATGFTLPGPSQCCDPFCFICGVPRNPINPFGCVADCQCGPGFCDAPSGFCFIPACDCVDDSDCFPGDFCDGCFCQSFDGAGAASRGQAKRPGTFPGSILPGPNQSLHAPPPKMKPVPQPTKLKPPAPEPKLSTPHPTVGPERLKAKQEWLREHPARAVEPSSR